MRNQLRKLVSHTVVLLCGLSVLLALVPLALVLFYVISQGVSSLNWAFFTEMPRPVGEAGGGMANSIAGTLIVVGIGALFAIPIGIVSGIYAAEYAGTRLASSVRFAADTLNGVPSIVIGVFVYGLAVLPFRRFSAVAGGLALGIMMVPLIMRTKKSRLSAWKPSLSTKNRMNASGTSAISTEPAQKPTNSDDFSFRHVVAFMPSPPPLW